MPVIRGGLPPPDARTDQSQATQQTTEKPLRRILVSAQKWFSKLRPAYGLRW
jgi:hypothetical protein